MCALFSVAYLVYRFVHFRRLVTLSAYRYSCHKLSVVAQNSNTDYRRNLFQPITAFIFFPFYCRRMLHLLNVIQKLWKTCVLKIQGSLITLNIFPCARLSRVHFW